MSMCQGATETEAQLSMYGLSEGCDIWASTQWPGMNAFPGLPSLFLKRLLSLSPAK